MVQERKMVGGFRSFHNCKGVKSLDPLELCRGNHSAQKLHNWLVYLETRGEIIL